MTVEKEIKQQVREFYDQVGWQEVSEGVYQNARYEDLRPVSREYIHKCHLRVSRHLAPNGRFLLDAGSGPIQYPEYLDYSRGYHARVCADISAVAVEEARQRIGDIQSGGKGLFVVADIANLPFCRESFDGVVSLHTIHHLPQEEHQFAYHELFRVLAPERFAVVVNGWDSARLMKIFNPTIRWANRFRWYVARKGAVNDDQVPKEEINPKPRNKPKGTYVMKNTPGRLKSEIGDGIPMKILVWRSVSVRFLRALIHPRLCGRWGLGLLFWLEERFPYFFGENGQYPLIVLCKTRGAGEGWE
ncbi:MAG: class I SAM-dependent methyltransferase [Anaerolineales bacterium]|nr:class I SAM-dependent methyltransferase [Anaerolineales bacterium]